MGASDRLIDWWRGGRKGVSQSIPRKRETKKTTSAGDVGKGGEDSMPGDGKAIRFRRRMRSFGAVEYQGVGENGSRQNEGYCGHESAAVASWTHVQDNRIGRARLSDCSKVMFHFH